MLLRVRAVRQGWQVSPDVSLEENEGEQSARAAWRTQFVRSFFERDLPQPGITIPAQALRRFWTMLAHYRAQIWNAKDRKSISAQCRFAEPTRQGQVRKRSQTAHHGPYVHARFLLPRR